LPLPYYAKETRENFQNSLLAWLINHSHQLAAFPKDWRVELE
jgi:hypothetical protein